MSDESNDQQLDQQSHQAHLDDAKEFFGEEESHEKKKQTSESNPEKKTEQQEDSVQNELLNSIGVKVGEKEASNSEEKKSSDDDDDLSPPPEDSSNRANWDILKTRKNEAVARVKELEAQLAEKSTEDASSESLKARVKELETENEKYSSRLKELDFKSHPEYFNKYEKPIQDAQDSLKQIAAQEDVEINVEALSALKGKDFAQSVSETLDQLSRFNGDRFSTAAQQLLNVITERDAIAQDSEEFIQKSNEQFQAQTRAIFDEVSQQYAQTLTPLEAPADASTEVKDQVAAYNAELAQVGTVAEQLAFGQLDQKQISQMSHEAAQYRFLMARGLPQLANNAGAKIKALQEELDAIKSAGPKYSPRSSDSKSSSKMEDMSHEEAARLEFAGLGGGV